MTQPKSSSLIVRSPIVRTPNVRGPVRYALAACALALSATALAQGETPTENTGSIIPDLDSIEGKDTDTLGLIYLGIADCERNAEIVINLPSVPDKQSLDIYKGEGCNATTRDTEDESNCTFIENVELNSTRDVKIMLNTSQLVSNCGDGTSSAPKLWFIAVDSSAVNEDVGTDYGFIPINIDTSAPDAPTRVSAGSGENTIPVSWSIGDEEVDHFYIYVDSGTGGASDASIASDSSADDGGSSTGGSSSSCGSGRLVEGAIGDDLPSTLRLSASLGATETDYDLNPDQVGGETAAVAVVAVDRAGNQSPLSEVVCVTIVPTDGFLDLYEMEAGHPIEQGCPCSAIGPAQAQAAWPIVLALGWVARRRRRS